MTVVELRVTAAGTVSAGDVDVRTCVTSFRFLPSDGWGHMVSFSQCDSRHLRGI